MIHSDYVAKKMIHIYIGTLEMRQCVYCSSNICLYKQVHCQVCTEVHHQHLRGTCIEVIYSQNKGYSIFATKNISVDCAITSYGGVYVTDPNQLSLTHSLQLKQDLWIDGPPSKISIADMIKQNKLGSMCNTAGPGETNNTTYKIDYRRDPPKVTLRASTKIKKNKEILVPYGKCFRMENKKSNVLFLYFLYCLFIFFSDSLASEHTASLEALIQDQKGIS